MHREVKLAKMLEMLGNLGTRAACDAIAAQPDGAPFTRMSESLIFASQPGAALSHA